MIEPEFGRRTSTGYYLAQNQWLVRGLSGIDRLLRRLVPSRRPQHQSRERILVAVGGHLGDAVIASSVLDPIREALPDARIGILVGSWSQMVLEDHPDVDWVHTWDHWKLNRSGSGLIGRFFLHWRARRDVLAELKSVGYDMALDLHPFFPNAAPLLWRAGIPLRVGFSSAGFGPLLTDPVDWEEDNRHIGSHQADLLRAAGLEWTEGEVRYANLASEREVGAGDRGDYVVVHMGAGLAHKEWPIDRWRALVHDMVSAGRRVVLTGSGPAQTQAAAVVADGLSGVTNLSDELAWDAFVDVVAGARVVVCVDSVTGHLAAAADVPAVVLMTGINRHETWRPAHGDTVVVSAPVPCAPCFRSRGCDTMDCINRITVGEVRAAIDTLLDGSGASAAVNAEIPVTNKQSGG